MSYLEVTVDDDFVTLVEDELGMSSGAWDMEDPKEVCAAVLKVARIRHADGMELEEYHDGI
jgi:hypothetical protein